MFEAELEAKFKRIFDLKKVTYDAVDPEAPEQETLFIEIEKARCNFIDTRSLAKVRGNVEIYIQNNKMPFGYLSKRIKNAAHADTKDLFFFDIEESSNRYQNLVRRSFSFIYNFNGQYDPNLGSITSIELEEQE